MNCKHEWTELFDAGRVPELVRELARIDRLLSHKLDHYRCTHCGRIARMGAGGTLNLCDEYYQAKREKDAAAWHEHWERLAATKAQEVQ